jgi:hypothetical protein
MYFFFGDHGSFSAIFVTLTGMIRVLYAEKPRQARLASPDGKRRIVQLSDPNLG